MSEVAIVDSGVANIGSVVAALEREGARVLVTREWSQIAAAPRVLLPGVGAAAAAMRELHALELAARLPGLRQPVLGICLGMQLMFRASAESSDDRPTAGLGIFDATVERLAASATARIPHMGWNALRPLREHPLTDGLAAGDYAYFVHSFAAPVDATTLVACDHGTAFAAIVARDNFMGAQFHPERSAAVGARLLRNFLSIT